MSTIDVAETALVVRPSRTEKLLALRGDLDVPLARSSRPRQSTPPSGWPRT